MARSTAQKSEGPSIREGLEAAIAESDLDTTPAPEPEITESEVANDQTEDSSVPALAEKEETPVREEKPAKTELQAEHERVQPVREPKAPVDWDLPLKERWKDTPPEVRNWIADRQLQVDHMLKESAAARKFSQEVVQTLEPYRAVMAAEGVQNPLQAIDGLMRITATLQMGSQQQKAQAITNLIKHYGLDIETLDQVLAGTAPPPDPVQSRLEQLLEQRMAPVNQLLQQVNQANAYQQEQLYGNAYQSIEQFGQNPRNEFFDSVRADMADFLDMAAHRGQPMTLQEAYDRACAVHPQISGIVAARNPAKVARDKRNAATSLAPSSSPGAVSTKGGSVRELIEANWGGDERI